MKIRKDVEQISETRIPVKDDKAFLVPGVSMSLYS